MGRELERDSIGPGRSTRGRHPRFGLAGVDLSVPVAAKMRAHHLAELVRAFGGGVATVTSLGASRLTGGGSVTCGFGGLTATAGAGLGRPDRTP
jgi:hypothetical protein